VTVAAEWGGVGVGVERLRCRLLLRYTQALAESSQQAARALKARRQVLGPVACRA
jgi:hypothetical protein